VIEVPCGEWTNLCAKDEQHTEWDGTSLSISGVQYSADFVLTLLPGDADNDGDFHDVTWLLFTFGDLAAAGGCPWNGTRDADFNNGGAVGSDDYSLMSSNFLTATACGAWARRRCRSFRSRRNILSVELHSASISIAMASSIIATCDSSRSPTTCLTRFRERWRANPDLSPSSSVAAKAAAEICMQR
jgi:hypothetical protein